MFQRDGINARVYGSMYEKTNIGDSFYIVIEGNGRVIFLYPFSKYNYVGKRLN